MSGVLRLCLTCGSGRGCGSSVGWWLARLMVWEEELPTSLASVHSRDASRRGRWRYLGDKDDCTPRDDAGLPRGSMLILQNCAELSAVACTGTGPCSCILSSHPLGVFTWVSSIFIVQRYEYRVLSLFRVDVRNKNQMNQRHLQNR